VLTGQGAKTTNNQDISDCAVDMVAAQVRIESVGRGEAESEAAGAEKSLANHMHEQKRQELFCRAQRRFGRLNAHCDSERLEVEYVTRESALNDGGKGVPLFIVYLVEDYEITRCVEVSKSSVFGLLDGADVHFVEQLISYVVEYFAEASQGAFFPSGIMGRGFSYQWLSGAGQ